MGGRYRSTIATPMLSLGERAARSDGIYPSANEGWEIPFSIQIKSHCYTGTLLPNHHRLMIGLPGSFLVFWSGSFRGVINWSIKGWTAETMDVDLVQALGDYIQLWYG
jgi:hypothetical protein